MGSAERLDFLEHIFLECRNSFVCATGLFDKDCYHPEVYQGREVYLTLLEGFLWYAK